MVPLLQWSLTSSNAASSSSSSFDFKLHQVHVVSGGSRKDGGYIPSPASNTAASKEVFM
jgi:hypothetical protein